MSVRSMPRRGCLRLDQLISQVGAPLEDAQEPFWRLIQLVRSTTRILDPHPVSGRRDFHEVNRVLLALLRMANLHRLWERPLECWPAPVGNPFVQYRALVSHLFDRYPVPPFLCKAWLCDETDVWQLGLYLHLAWGRALRQFKPLNRLRMTKRVVRCFMQAPADLSPMEALRWAQVRALGGDDRVSRIIAACPWLKDLTEDEEFWESAMAFFVAHQPIAEDELAELLRFLYRQRFLPAETVLGYGAGPLPLQPGLSLSGRTLLWLRTHQANWRTDLGLRTIVTTTPEVRWEASGIKAFHWSTEAAVWSIEELLTAQELRVEGQLMQHCVASYVFPCLRRESSIWSMRHQSVQDNRRLLTIEVLPDTKTIRQIKGPRNSPPTEFARTLISQWASQEGLVMPQPA